MQNQKRRIFGTFAALMVIIAFVLLTLVVVARVSGGKVAVSGGQVVVNYSRSDASNH